ncbi:SusF/SusE family outer membrane protein [Draconibacterium orientale]|uniref:SusF/SusE family outer membrane protein n=1 Tax=Draconibacterium orientale TaxID=1168034 RepID=UPI002ABE2EA0|nr:SusF/SusE family outer membrane protein [Draconibacterium orientale]
MKRNKILILFASLIVAVALFSACTEDTADVRLEPTLSTANTLNVSSDSATVVGFVVAEGDGFTERGVCYSTTEGPTVDGNKTIYSENTPDATFYVTLSGLDYATKYYARAYATGEAGTVYGEEVTFTTLPVVPFLTTAEISDITGNSAMGGGEVTGNGGADVTAYGICFGTSENPTTADATTNDGEGTGAFESMLSELQGNTMYYVRAYATNSAGTGYGPQVSFTTLVDLPKVTTTAVSGITKTSAVTGGAVTDNGGADITRYGIVWGLNSEPTTTDNVIEATMEMDSFVIDLSELQKYTTYYVRAFATNSAGTGYGENIEFTTLADILTWYIPGDYIEDSYPGSGLSNWSPENSPYIMSTIDNGTSLEGYVYMAKTDNQWKFATQPNWDGPNYGDGGDGVLDANADNIHSPAGYYKLNADATAGTFTAVATEWGVIGSGSPNGWDDETALTYSPEDTEWQGVLHLTADEIKFRANHSWDYNYGSNAADGILQAGGNNIPVDVESDYSIVLDLSTPNEYTYSLNRWGLIGDATPGGWDNDTNMTWDADNGVFTVTLDLIAGSFKFRANDGWDVNFGGDINALSAGGDNIAVAEDGNYTITFDPWGLTATVTKN